MNDKKEFIPFNGEWEKEMMQHSKKQLIALLKCEWINGDKKEKCRWKIMEKDYNQTGCGDAFGLSKESLKFYKYCPKCGKEIELIFI
jgi:predicted RNA-binding Zn-ribbon protein involved in translation (DUF1610 family)